MNRPQFPAAPCRMAGHRRAFTLVAITVVSGLCTTHAAAVTHLKRGAEAPVVKLSALDGGVVDTAALGGHSLVLVFGELYHEKTLAACAEIRAALASEKLEAGEIRPFLIVAQDAPRDALRSRAADAARGWRILHDVERSAFGTYRVAVMPSVVVVDGEGRVVHAAAGYTDRLRDIVTDALLVSLGALSPQEFDRTLHPAPAAEPSEEQVRAARLTSLARQLTRRGLAELAEEKFVEALELAPAHVPARLGLGMLRLRRGQLAEAELEFRTVLNGEPMSLDARLGLAYVQTLRGGEEIVEAETLVRALLASAPTEPRVHYLMGLIEEQRGRMDDAVASFRTAVELLLSQRGTWEDTSAEQRPDG